MGSLDYRQLIAEFRNNRALTVSFVALIVGSQAWMIVPYVDIPDKEPDYYHFVLHYVYDCDPYSLPFRDESPTRNPLKWWTNCASYKWFDSPKLIPLLFNIGVMPLVYVIGSRMTGNRLVGLIALVAFVYNPLYSDWKTNGTYDQTWSFLLLLSVALMYHTRFSVLAFAGSMFAKTLSLMYLPAWIYTNYKIRKSKVEAGIILFYLVIAVWSASAYVNLYGSHIEFHPERWEDAVYRNISVLWQVIPFLALFVVLNRNFIPKDKVPNLGVVALWIGVILLQNPIIYLFTTQDTYSYRYVPLAAFMGIFIGMTLVNMGNWIVEQKLRRTKIPSL